MLERPKTRTRSPTFFEEMVHTQKPQVQTFTQLETKREEEGVRATETLMEFKKAISVLEPTHLQQKNKLQTTQDEAYKTNLKTSVEELIATQEQKFAELKKQREQERSRAQKVYEEQREQEQAKAKTFYEEQREYGRLRAKTFLEEQQLKAMKNLALIETTKSESMNFRHQPQLIPNHEQDDTAVKPQIQKVKVAEDSIPVLTSTLVQTKSSEIATSSDQKTKDVGKVSKGSDGTEVAPLISTSEETVATKLWKIECKTFLSSLIQSLLSCFCLDSKLEMLPKLIERKLENVLDQKNMYRRLQTYQDLKLYESKVEDKLDEQLESVALVFPTTELFQDNIGNTVPTVMDDYKMRILEKSWPQATTQNQNHLQDLQAFTDCTVSVIIDLAILLFILKQKERELLKSFQTKPLKSTMETEESRCYPPKVKFINLNAI